MSLQFQRSPFSNLKALGHSPVKLDNLRCLLETCPHKGDAFIFSDGFSNGFSLQYQGPREASTHCQNLKSARDPGMEHIVLQKLNKGISLGRKSGPFEVPPISNLKVSPIGISKERNRAISTKSSLVIP